MKRTRSNFLKFISALMALVYLSGIVVTDLVHPLIHGHQEEAIHTQSNEQDPCHRAIYHGEEEKSANHHSHLIPNDTKCQLCDIVYHSEHTLVNDVPVTGLQKVISPKAFFSSFLSFGFHHLCKARAPPIFA